MNVITRSIPNTITCCNLVSGVLAITFAFRPFEQFGPLAGYEWVWVCIGLAAVFDFCDGLSARLLKAYSAMGKELDSLSDLVSFGVAPAMLLFNLLQAPGAPAWLPYAAILIPVMGQLRLARFNIDDSQATVFRGLPIPAEAIFWIGATAWLTSCPRALDFGPDWLVGLCWSLLVAAASLMMVAPMRMFSLKLKSFGLAENLPRYVLILGCLAFVIGFGVAGFAPAIVLYILLSAVAPSR
ncbi:MAG: CDP-alcohol phosphatidyltransferase family protein [Muribaculaceae bacterium]|nr:CDP-alcohol phosphatidyltransferase family protein [Muribaculaceae bacterium]MDE7142494.1 CDP-alcohol phosphatidyltransferase family protein [Muribaculaceae bacterium]